MKFILMSILRCCVSCVLEKVSSLFARFVNTIALWTICWKSLKKSFYFETEQMLFIFIQNKSPLNVLLPYRREIELKQRSLLSLLKRQYQTRYFIFESKLRILFISWPFLRCKLSVNSRDPWCAYLFFRLCFCCRFRFLFQINSYFVVWYKSRNCIHLNYSYSSSTKSYYSSVTRFQKRITFQFFKL